MIRRPPRSTLSSSSAASDVYKRQVRHAGRDQLALGVGDAELEAGILSLQLRQVAEHGLDGRQRETGEGALDVDADRRFAVAVERREALLDADVDVGHVPEVDGRPRRGADDDAAHLLGPDELALALEQDLAPLREHEALRGVAVPAVERLGDLARAQVKRL